MHIELMKGTFSSKVAIDLVAEMIQTKIKYHENKINKCSNEEDIKTIEKKIKQLQYDLFELRKNIVSKMNLVKLDVNIKIEEP